MGREASIGTGGVFLLEYVLKRSREDDDCS